MSSFLFSTLFKTCLRPFFLFLTRSSTPQPRPDATAVCGMRKGTAGTAHFRIP